MGGKRRGVSRCNPSSSTLVALSLSLSIRVNGIRIIDILVVAHRLPPWISRCPIGQVDGYSGHLNPSLYLLCIRSTE
jgi:hypothetical protein